jgi:hypothetical protein
MSESCYIGVIVNCGGNTMSLNNMKKIKKNI